MKERFQIDRTDGNIYAMGTTAVAGGMHFSFAAQGEKAELLLYKKGSRLLKARISFPENTKTGDVWSMTVKGDFRGLEYVYAVDGQETEDPYGRQFTGRERWGSLEQLKGQVRTPAVQEGGAFDWEDDKLPQIPYQDCIIYHIHPRGFTKHPSSGVEPKKRGTFAGIEDKIPYLKNLGITTLEMMPPVEFEEIIVPERVDGSPFGPEKPEGKVNYWGYTRGRSFAPKASYCSGPVREPVKEFKTLVKHLHREGLELVIELYFDGREAPAYVLDAVRFWAREYHVDGVRLVGCGPLKLLGEDPYLSRLKLFAENWEGVSPGKCRHLAEYNDGFLIDMRRFLKGDEGQLDQAAFRCRRNPANVGAVNYMACTNGFTMMDMVSYDVKHNEENGEEGRDGTDYNQSWNCGTEGPSRKKKIVRLRKKQLRNAMLMLFLSQGTPLIMEGDEFGRTKKGNNNSYCQDNEISWVNWGLKDSNSDLYEFAAYVIGFRREHPVFHMEKEPALLDYKSVGLPDVSYHGEKTWCPQFENFRRQLGILYCGKYGKRADGSEDNYFYVAYNMHWEPHEFALPNLPRELCWQVAFDTDAEAVNGFYPPGSEKPLENQKRIMVMSRSIVVLIGKEAEEKAWGAGAKEAGETGKEKNVRNRKSRGSRPKKAVDAAEGGEAEKQKAVDAAEGGNAL